MSIGTLSRLESDVGKLLESRAPTKGQDYTGYADDPVGFLRDVLHWEPWKSQIEIAEAVRDHPMVVVSSCNSMGKDALSARLALWHAYARGGLCIITSTSERQLKGIVMRELRAAFLNSKLSGELFELMLRVDREKNVGVVAFTSSSASASQGWHQDQILGIISEAQGVEDFTFEAMHACQTGDRDRLLVCGNPLAPSGPFFHATRNKAWRHISVSAEQHPNIVEGKVVIPGGVTQSFIQKIKDIYGAESPQYQSRVLGRFPDSATDGIFRRSWLVRAAELYETGAFSDSDAEPIVSVDVARHGSDRTAVLIRRGQRMVRFETWHNLDLVESADRLVPILAAEGIKPKVTDRPARSFRAKGRIVVDEMGVGSGLIDTLKSYGYAVTGFYGMKPQKGNKYANLRARAFWNLRTQLEAGSIAMEWNDDLVTELLAHEYKLTPSGIQVESKKTIKQSLGGTSPDLADSLSMAFYDDVRPRARVVDFSPMANFPGASMFDFST